MDWKVERIPELTGYTIEWAEPENYYLSRRNQIYHSTNLKPPFREIGRIDAPAWKQSAARFRLGQRLLRFLVYNVIPLKNGEIFVTFDKSVGVIAERKYQTLDGLVRPCRVLRSGCAVDAEGSVFFGEYLANKEKGEMRIYRYVPGSGRLDVAYTFPRGAITHIHGLYFDPFSGSVFCLTGDAERECQILRSRDGFVTHEVVGSGDETWRAVSLLFDENYIYYGTDAEFCDNKITRIDRETLKRIDLGDVNGTVFYSKILGRDMFFTTTAENAPSQKENVAAVWHIDPQGQCGRLISFEKDVWPAGPFMFGTIHFPCLNAFDDRLYFNLVGVKGDGQTFCVRKSVQFS
jgi:hypothetical protein